MRVRARSGSSTGRVRPRGGYELQRARVRGNASYTRVSMRKSSAHDSSGLAVRGLWAAFRQATSPPPPINLKSIPCPNDIPRSLAPPPRPPQPIQCHSVVGCVQEVPPTTKSATIGRRAQRARGVEGGFILAVDFFAWLPVGVNSNKPARGSVSLI